MRKREGILPLASVFLLLSFALFIIGNTVVTVSLTQAFRFVTLPLQRALFQTTHIFHPDPLENENMYQAISAQIEESENSREMQALRDQFETEDPRSSQLLPATIVGYKGYVPGVHKPVSITLDKGSEDGVITGQAVVYQDNLIGRITTVTSTLSEVMLLTNSSLSFTAESLTNNAIGVIHGGQENIIMDNVVLSETLENDDIIVTKGDMQPDGSGFPPNLVVGKIVSVDRDESDLFQSARLESLVDVITLQTVFILHK